jgi:hypothetical protein
MDGQRCQNCRFSLQRHLFGPDAAWLTCRRYPPESEPVKVRAGDWCGEWAKREEVRG